VGTICIGFVLLCDIQVKCHAADAFLAILRRAIQRSARETRESGAELVPGRRGKYYILYTRRIAQKTRQKPPETRQKKVEKSG
jgi:hypothetical protein